MVSTESMKSILLLFWFTICDRLLICYFGPQFVTESMKLILHTGTD